MKLAVHRESKECVAVKILHLDGKNGLTPDCLKKEVRTYVHVHIGYSDTLAGYRYSLDARLFLIVRGRDEGRRVWYTLIAHAHNLPMNLHIMNKQ